MGDNDSLAYRIKSVSFDSPQPGQALMKIVASQGVLHGDLPPGEQYEEMIVTEPIVVPTEALQTFFGGHPDSTLTRYEDLTAAVNQYIITQGMFGVGTFVP